MDLQKAFSSSIGSKFLIALTGIFLLIFLIAHLAGNLLFIAGPDAFNEYSHKLISNPLVYVAELGLLAVFVLHIFKTVGMLIDSYSARPDRYAKM
jgi:succinate dehydrogenase / fumarate reductase cytochrome b subunit